MVSQMLFLLISVVAINSGLGYADDDFQSHAVYPELGAQPHATDSESSPSKGFVRYRVVHPSRALLTLGRLFGMSSTMACKTLRVRLIF